MPSVKTNAIRVGAFMVVGVTLSIAALIYFGATDLLQRNQTFVTYFNVTVQGLNIDSPVKYRGVTIGSVAEMEIAPDGELIEVLMDLDYDFVVNDSLTVRMNITGITGLRYLEMDFASPAELDLTPKIGFETVHPLIPSVPGGFEELETALKTVYERFLEVDAEGISYEAKEFFRSGTLAMAHADSILMQPDFTAWVGDLNSAISNMEEMIVELRDQRLNVRVDSMMNEMHLATIEARQGAQHLNEALGILNQDVQHLQLSKRADSLFADINATFDQTSALMGQSQYSISQVVSQLSYSVTELNTTLGQMSALLMSLEEYPGQLLYTAPPKDEE
jgi:phospholipid/cholesterol/gamma-HCH transport system substrate-binding protein